MDQLTMFAQNIYLLIGLLLFLIIVIVFIIASWTGLNVLFFLRGKRTSDQALAAAKIGPDGRPLPPAGQGICDRCQAIPKEVYFMPEGERLCRSCYEAKLISKG